MRVLFFNYEYPPLGGGAGNATDNILREYAKIPGLEVDLVTSSFDNNFHFEKIGRTINIHKLPIGKNSKNWHFQSQRDLLKYSCKAYFYSRKLTAKNKFDLSHSFFTVPCGFLSLLFKWQYGIPYIISLRGADVPGFSGRFSLLYYFLTPIIKIIWKKAEKVVACSTGLKELAQKTNPIQNMEVIPNGINTELFKPDAVRRPGDKFIVTQGGTRLTERKGIKYLIKAIHIISSHYPRIYLKIIGEGDEKESLENQCRELGIDSRVEFLGKIPNQKLPVYYQEASLFILPSLNEGMSNAMLEALASGLPIIATNTGGASELVRESQNGFLIKMKNASDIADKIMIFLKNKDLCRIYGENSRKIAESMSWEKVADKYYEAYKKVK